MSQDDEQEHHERLFTLAEANRLIPQLNSRLTSVKQARETLVRTKEDIRKASARAEYGGGSTVGALYITSLQQVSANIKAIHELGSSSRILIWDSAISPPSRRPNRVPLLENGGTGDQMVA